MERIDPARHITTILTIKDPWEGSAKTLEHFARLPDPIGQILQDYANNIRLVGLHYSYPFRIYVAWMCAPKGARRSRGEPPPALRELSGASAGAGRTSRHQAQAEGVILL